MKKLLSVFLSSLFILTLIACTEETTLDEIPPVVTVDASKPVAFEFGSEEPDWTTYISATDDVDGEITITESMVNTNNVNMTQIGTFMVLFTVEDSAGNKALKTINISIRDTTAPVLSIEDELPMIFEVGSDAPDFTTYITANDNADGEIVITAGMIDTSNVDMDTVGTFDVIYAVSDYRENESTETIIFTINDTTAPVITVSNSAQFELLSGTTEPDWTTYITANDNYDGVITITDAMVDGSEVDMNTIGTFEVYFSVEDSSGNEATESITVTITLNDEAAPIITLNPEAALELDLNSDAPDWTTYITVNDNLDGNITVLESMVDATDVDMTTVGTYDIIFTVEDQTGNEAILTIQVNVVIPDTEAPVLTLVEDVQTAFIAGSDEPDWITFITANDNIDGDITITEAMIDASNVNMDVVGQFNVIYTVSDAKENEAVYTLTIYIVEDSDYVISTEVYNYPFNVEDDGTLALPNLLEGNGYYVNDEGSAETVYMDGETPVFGYADSWTFVSTGYDLGVEEYMIEAKVTALGQQAADTSPIFSVRIDYDWLMDIHFNFNNNSWSGVAVHGLPGGSAYSNNAEAGGLASDLVLDMNRSYTFKILIQDSLIVGEDLLTIFIDGRKVMERSVPEINANAQHIFGASAGSHIEVDYFKANLVTEDFDYYQPTINVFDYSFDVEDDGTLALPNLLEGNGYYVNDEGSAETVYMDGETPVFGYADSWTFVSTGYDLGIEEYVIEAKVTALGQQAADTSPIFSVRIDYDWLMDIHFNFNNNSWSGVAVHGLPGGSAYSNNAEAGGLAPSLVLEMNVEYIFRVVILDGNVENEDVLIIYVNDMKVMELNVPDVNANAQHILGASAGSHIEVDYFKANLAEVLE
jgi:hypothetical protein